MSFPHLCALLLVFAACSPGTSGELSSSDALLKKSVGFAYFLGDGFIHLISSNSGPTPSLLKDFERLSKDDRFQEHSWKEISFLGMKLAWSYLGFSIFLIFGIIFVILLPLVGLIFFCCRCCGNCGGYTNIMDEKNDPKKRGFYSFILLLLLTLKTAALVIAFINNYLASVSITQQDVTLIPLIDDLKAFNSSLTATIQRTREHTSSDLTKEREAFDAVLVEAFKDFKREFRTNSGANRFIEPIDSFIKLSQKYSEPNQVQFQRFLKAYQSLPVVLSEIRDGIERELNNAISTTNLQMVTEMSDRIKKELVMNPSMETDFKPDVIGNFLQTLSNDLPQIESLSEFNKTLHEIDVKSGIQQDLDKTWKDLSNDSERRESLSQSFSAALQVAQLGIHHMVASLHPEALLVSQAADIELRYRYYIGYGLLGIPSLIALCLYFGVCFGICGRRPYSDGAVCTKNVGANFLMGAVIMIFLLAPLLMLVCILLFSTSGVTEAAFCGPLKEPSRGSTATIDTIYQFVSRKIGKQPELTWMEELTPFDSIWIRCKDESLVNAFGGGMIKLPIDNDLEEILKGLTERIKNNDMKTKISTKITETQQTMQALQESYESLIFDTSISALAQPITKVPNWQTLFADLRKIDPTRFNDYIVRLEESAVRPLDAVRLDISRNLQEMLALSDYWDQVTGNMELFNSGLEAKLDSSIEKAIIGLSGKLHQQLRLAVMAMWQPIDCKNLYEAAHKTTDTSCQGFIQPFNGYLYGLGFSVILYIPILVFAILLIGLYRKSVSYDDEVSEANYMNYQGFYMADPSVQGDTKKKSKRKSKKASPKTGSGEPGLVFSHHQGYQPVSVFPYDAYE